MATRCMFKIEIRGENETAWKPLHENLRERLLQLGFHRVSRTANIASA